MQPAAVRVGLCRMPERAVVITAHPGERKELIQFFRADR